MIGMRLAKPVRDAIGNHQNFRDASPIPTRIEASVALPQRIGYDPRHALPRHLCDGLCEAVRFRILNIETHNFYRYLFNSTFIPRSATRFHYTALAALT